MTDTASMWCPRCLELTGDAPACPKCGLRQTGEDVARLRVVVRRLYEIDTAQRDLALERATLAEDHGQLLAAVGGFPAAGRIGGGGNIEPDVHGRGDVRADVVRDVLLWLGGLLLAIAALTFAAFAWQRLDDGGRAALLVAGTAASAGVAFALRRSLAATAEVFAALTVVLFLVDWLALRTAGVGDDLDLPTWWAVGSALAGSVSFAVGRAFVSARVLTGATLAAAGFLAVAAGETAAAGTSLALSLLAVVLVGAGRLGLGTRWSPASATFLVAAAGSVVAGAVAVLVGIADHGEASAVLAAAAAALGLAPALAIVVLRPGPPVDEVLASLSSSAVLAGAATAWWLVVEEPWLAAVVTATSAAAAGAALLAPRRSARAVVAGCAAVAAVAFALSAGDVAAAVFGPLSSLERAWERGLFAAADGVLHDAGAGIGRSDAGAGIGRSDAGAAAVVVSFLGLLAVGGTLRERGRTGIGVAAAAGSLASAVVLALLPLTGDASVAVAVVATAVPSAALLVGAGASARRGRSDLAAGLAVAAGAAAVPATGWALAAEVATLLAAGVATAGALTAARLAPAGSWVRIGSSVASTITLAAIAAATAASVGAGEPEVGFAVAAAAAVSLAAAGGLFGEDGLAAEVMSCAVAFVGVGLAFEDEVALAVALTALVPAFAAAGSRPGRAMSSVAAVAVAVAATWGWLAVADVGLLEAYTLPAAVGALAGGHMGVRPRIAAGSWVRFAPALTVALGPTLVVAVADDALVRPLAAAGAGTAAAWAGARWRLQAPLVLGAVAVAVVALDTLGPVAAELPRWSTIAALGALLVWFGATAERRLLQLRDARERLASLENGAGSDPTSRQD